MLIQKLACGSSQTSSPSRGSRARLRTQLPTAVRPLPSRRVAAWRAGLGDKQKKRVGLNIRPDVKLLQATAQPSGNRSETESQPHREQHGSPGLAAAARVSSVGIPRPSITSRRLLLFAASGRPPRRPIFLEGRYCTIQYLPPTLPSQHESWRTEGQNQGCLPGRGVRHAVSQRTGFRVWSAGYKSGYSKVRITGYPRYPLHGT